MISIFMAVRKACFNIMNQIRRTLSDYFGSAITRKWKKIPTTNIVTVNPLTFPEVIRIYHQIFNTTSDASFFRYSKIFNHIFYVAKQGSKVVGYCVYYIKPSISIKGIKKEAIIYSIAVDKEYQKHGIGKEILLISIQEMIINNISEITLYVNKKNHPAYTLYTKIGFKIISELENICGEGENCYKMRLYSPKRIH